MSRSAWSRTLALLSIVCTLQAHVDAQTVSVRGSIGCAYLPMADWSDFFGEIVNSNYQKNNPNTYVAFSLHCTFSEHHSVNVGAEVIRSSASLTTTPPMFSLPGPGAIVIDWKFQGIPLSVGYEYRFTPFSEHFLPLVGIGVSYVWSEVEATDHFFDRSDSRKGTGYGVHGSVGLVAQVTNSLGMVTQVRYRYSDGMAFSGANDDVRVEFTGLDVSIGLEWTFR
jgi:opacity protein-like surface antigen